MNKKIYALRFEQKLALSAAETNLSMIQEEIHNAFEMINDEAKRFKVVAPLIHKERELEREIEFLKSELLEKKFANHLAYSDVNPYEVIEEKTPTTMIIREMVAVEKPEAREARLKSFVPGGFCGHFDNYLQEWEITSNIEGMTRTIRRHKDNNWYDASGNRYSIEAEPRKFYDYNF